MMRFIFFLLFFNLLSAEVVYVKSKHAQLYNHPNEKPFVTRIKIGMELQVIKKVQRWLQVVYKDQKYWVYKGQISRKIPRRDKSLFVKNYDEVATSSAVRSFPHTVDPASKMSRRTGNSQYLKYMYYHQSFIVTNKKNIEIAKLDRAGIKLHVITIKDLDNFLARGKIGEYANFSKEE